MMLEYFGSPAESWRFDLDNYLTGIRVVIGMRVIS